MSLRAATVCVFGVVSCMPLAAQERVKQVNSTVAIGTADPLLAKVDKAIETTSRRYLVAESHTPWQILHGILALRHEFVIKRNGKKVSALEWLSDNADYKGTPYFRKSRWGGEAQPFTKPYIFQGHPCQFLAILTMTKLPKDHVFRFKGQAITIQDLINHAKAEVNAEEEITWVLWALAHYLPSDSVWKNKHGESWSIERLVRIQTRANVYNAACGGTHGLFALAVARNNYIAENKQLRGIWIEADQKIRRYAQTARYYQNSDGSFSNSHFQGRSYSYDFNTRIASSGHQLEFLMMALPQDRLREDWVRKGIAATAKDLVDHKASPADCGPLYHALSALKIYRDRIAPPKVKVESESKDQPSKNEDKKSKPTKTQSQTESSKAAVSPANEKKSTEGDKIQAKDGAEKKTADKPTAKPGSDVTTTATPDSASAGKKPKSEPNGKAPTSSPQTSDAEIAKPSNSAGKATEQNEDDRSNDSSGETPAKGPKPIVAEEAIAAGSGVDIGDAKPAGYTLHAPPAPLRIPAATEPVVPQPIDE